MAPEKAQAFEAKMLTAKDLAREIGQLLDERGKVVLVRRHPAQGLLCEGRRSMPRCATASAAAGCIWGRRFASRSPSTIPGRAPILDRAQKASPRPLDGRQRGPSAGG